jgi:hypothetical protein
MEYFEMSSAEMLNVLAAMEVAADVYQAEANRTGLADVKRTLKKRAEVTRVIAGSLRRRALDNPEFARVSQYQNAAPAA